MKQLFNILSLFIASAALTFNVSAMSVASHFFGSTAAQSTPVLLEDSLKNTNELWLKAQGNLGFLENKGQFRDLNDQVVPQVLFKAEAADLNIWITYKGITFQTFKQEKQLIPEAELSELDKQLAAIKRKPKKQKLVHWERIDVELVGGSIKSENIVKDSPQQGSQNYYLGNEAAVVGVNHYKKITIKDVYPGIDWVWYFDGERGYKYDFIVHPGANYGQIKLAYKSKNPINLNPEGELELRTQYGNLKELKPISFLVENELTTRFNQLQQRQITLNGDTGYETIYSFVLPETSNAIFDELLVIDPVIFWSTIYGGNYWDGPGCLAVDSENNIFMGGYTYSSNFPTLSNGTFFQSANLASTTGFIVKFSETGSLIWSTYIGGSGGEELVSIDINAADNLYAGGTSGSLNFPFLNPGGGAFFQTTTNIDVGFIVKFSNDGSLLWSTSFPAVRGVRVDPNDNLFVCSDVYNSNYPLTNPGGAYIQNYASALPNNLMETYLAKFSSTGVLQWSTFFGGSEFELASSITTDSLGNLYFTGTTFSADVPLLNPGNGAYFQNSVNPIFGNAFLAKFTNNGALQWSTCFGGTDTDYGKSLVTDQSDNVFWAGETYSTDITCVDPGGGAFFQNTNAGAIDAFLCKFSNTGNLLWSTYYGTPEEDVIQNSQHLTIDNCGRFHFSYNTAFLTSPTVVACEGGYVAPGTGFYNAYLSRFSNSGQLQWATYVGGEGSDIRSPITNDCEGNLIIAGEWITISGAALASYPLVNPGNGAYFINNFNFPNGGDEDGFIMKFDVGLPVACNLEYNLCLNNPMDTIVEILDNVLSIGSIQGLPQGITVDFSNEQLVFSGTPTQSGVFEFTIPLFTDICGCETNLTYEGTFIIDSIVSLDLGNDTTVCASAYEIIPVVATPGASYTWSTNETTPTITINASGTYFLEIEVSGCTFTDSINVTLSDILAVDLGDSIVFCEGDSSNTFPLQLDAGPTYQSYLWSDGSTSQTLEVSTPGVYSVSVQSGACVSTDSITISTVSFDGLILVQNTEGCSPLLTNFLVEYYSSDVLADLTWSFGDGDSSNGVSPTHSYQNSGVYEVAFQAVSELGCVFSIDTTLLISVIPNPIASFGIDPNFPEIGNTVFTENTSQNAQSYSWFLNDVFLSSNENASIFISDYGAYQLMLVAENEFCVDSNIVIINIVEDLIYYIPNAFTPNGDEFNTLFSPIFTSGIDVTSYQFLIFNRWGEVIFESNDSNAGWDGTYQKVPVNDGVYTYKVRFKELNTAKVYEVVGHVNLLK